MPAMTVGAERVSARAARSPRAAAVAVEVVALSLDPDPRDGADPVLGYRVLRGDVEPGEHPDVSALLVAGCASPDVSHSTSWRWEDGSVVLTYALVPDPAPGPTVRHLHDPAVVWSGDPTRPSPPALHEHHVVAHAVRHLAGLIGTDPGIARVAAEDRTGLWAAIAWHADLPVARHSELPRHS
jgi:hypothetical protein